jgi:hypothetical protein
MSVAMTVAPSAANAAASAAPCPLAAPVMITTFPSTRPISSPPPLVCRAGSPRRRAAVDRQLGRLGRALASRGSRDDRDPAVEQIPMARCYEKGLT